MRKLFPFRRVTSVLILGGLLNLASCVVVAQALGGSALDGRRDGEDYLLKDHRHRYTKVSPAVWHFSRAHGISVVFTSGLMALALVLQIMEARSRKA